MCVACSHWFNFYLCNFSIFYRSRNVLSLICIWYIKLCAVKEDMRETWASWRFSSSFQNFGILLIIDELLQSDCFQFFFYFDYSTHCAWMHACILKSLIDRFIIYNVAHTQIFVVSLSLVAQSTWINASTALSMNKSRNCIHELYILYLLTNSSELFSNKKQKRMNSQTKPIVHKVFNAGSREKWFSSDTKKKQSKKFFVMKIHFRWITGHE